MNHDELMDWLESCPTHKWEIINTANEYVTVIFPVYEDEDFDDVAILDPDFDEIEDYSFSRAYD